MEYNAHYTDETHDCDILIQNMIQDGIPHGLRFVLDGIPFIGSSLDDFELADAADYETAKKLVHLTQWGGYAGYGMGKMPYVYSLQRYGMKIRIPVTAVKRDTQSSCQGLLTVEYVLKEHDKNKNQSRCWLDSERIYMDDAECIKFCITIEDQEYCADRPSLCFEQSLLQINAKCREKYLLKCCFTCQYSDYSPYGNDDFGTMLCFKKYKEIYLTVNNKEDFFGKLEGLEYDIQQETWLCDSFEERIHCEGYRGKV